MRAFYLLLFISIFISCRKIYQRAKPQTADDPENLTGQLTGTWKLYAQTSSPENDWNGDGLAETNMYGVYSDCARDAGFSFENDGKGILKASCVDSRAMNWQIKNSSNDLIYSANNTGISGAYQTARIIQLNQRYFIISHTMQASNGKTYTINSRYFR
jgi:hypothetical protein